MVSLQHRSLVPFVFIRTHLIITIAFVGIFFPAAADAQNAPFDASFMRYMPKAEEVLARFARSGDPIQSLGRQCAALDLLERTFFRSPAIMTAAVTKDPATRSVRENYAAAFTRLRQQYIAAVGGMDDNKQRTWSAMCERGGAGVLNPPVTTNEVMAMLRPEVQTAYKAAIARSDQMMAQQRARQQAATELAARNAARDKAVKAARDAERAQYRLITLAIGGAMLAVGVFGFVRSGRTLRGLKKYEFENITPGGVVEFESFEDAERHRKRGFIASRMMVPAGILAIAGGAAVIGAFVSF